MITKLFVALLASMMATNAMGQANDFEKIQANMANRMMSSLQGPTESTTANASTDVSSESSSSLPTTSTMANPRVVSPIMHSSMKIRTRRSPQNSYGDNSDPSSGQSNSIYMPGSGPNMPDASSTAAPQFGLGVTYSNMATAKPTTSTANPAAAWYSNWLNSLPDSLKALYGVTTTQPPQGLVGRRRRSIARLARRRRSIEELASTPSTFIKSMDLSTKNFGQDNDDNASTESIAESSTAKGISRRRRSPQNGFDLGCFPLPPWLCNHGRSRRSIEELASTGSPIAKSMDISSEEDASTEPMTESSTEDASTESSETPNNILRSKRSMSEIRDRVQSSVQGLFNGSALGLDENSSEDPNNEITSDEPSWSDILHGGDSDSLGGGLLPSASSDSTGTPIQVDDIDGLSEILSQSAGNTTDNVQVVYLNTSSPSFNDEADLSSESSSNDSVSTDSTVALNSTSMP